jgi:ketol-acid reductoisomerase
MASRSFTRALRSPITRQLTANVAPRRTFVSALGGARAIVPVSKTLAGPAQQTRGIKQMDFAGHKETVYGMHLTEH